MKTIKFILILLIAVPFTSCTSQEKKSDKVVGTVEIISVENLDKVDANVQLIDVRTPQEYGNGYIKNAKNINFFDDDFMQMMGELDKNQPVYIYCKSGVRSGKAASKLKAAGFTKVYDLDGGIVNWESTGKDLTKK